MAKEYAKLLVSQIVVNREARQRKTVGTVQDLADSIQRVGQINPITVTRDGVLIAGERRLEACKLISMDYKISVRYVDELDSTELQLIELEENLKRAELSWQDQCRAVSQMHSVLSSLNAGWTQVDTANHLGYTSGFISQCLEITRQLKDEKIAKADSMSVANNIIQRNTQRAVDNELNQMMDIAAPEEKAKSGIKAKIFNENFLEVAGSYTGAKYNLIHCDFPYGIDHGNSEQGNIKGGGFTGYKDSEHTYWTLCKSLCENLDKIAYPSAHVMFWFSMKYYSKTIEFFQQNSNLELVMEQPLIWFKSDNKGIVSDVNRRPRNVYETALLFSRGDRKIISPIANLYACPTSKSIHPSEKPEPMLKHFFRMFIDDYSEVLDPTCGSGTAIRAAMELGARRSVGYEIDTEFATAADSALTRAKGLKQLEKEI